MMQNCLIQPGAVCTFCQTFLAALVYLLLIFQAEPVNDKNKIIARQILKLTVTIWNRFLTNSPWTDCQTVYASYSWWAQNITNWTQQPTNPLTHVLIFGFPLLVFGPISLQKHSDTLNLSKIVFIKQHTIFYLNYASSVPVWKKTKIC